MKKHPSSPSKSESIFSSVRQEVAIGAAVFLAPAKAVGKVVASLLATYEERAELEDQTAQALQDGTLRSYRNNTETTSEDAERHRRAAAGFRQGIEELKRIPGGETD